MVDNVDKVELVAECLVSESFCPTHDGQDEHWPPPGTWCDAADYPGRPCLGCTMAWLKQLNADEVKALRLAVERAVKCLVNIPGFCPKEEDKDWPLTGEPMADWCQRSCNSCARAWLMRPEEPANTDTTVPRKSRT